MIIGSTVALTVPVSAVDRSRGSLSPRARLLAQVAAGQSVALVAVLLVVRAVGAERAGLAPAGRRGWVAAAGGVAALVVVTDAIRSGTLARRPRSRRWITRELAAVEQLNPASRLDAALYVPVALQAAAWEELVFRGLLPASLARGRSRTCATRALLALFGLGHAYQGLHRMVVTVIYGLLLGEVARAGRSVRPAVALHAALDLQLLWLSDHPLRPGPKT